jgi:hypothetical protein
VDTSPACLRRLATFGHRCTLRARISNTSRSRQPRARGDVAERSEIRAIPLAAGVLARAGIVLSPAVGAVLMSLSTVTSAIDAPQLLRRACHRQPAHDALLGLISDLRESAEHLPPT